MVPVGILQNSTIIRVCDTEKKSKGKIIKKAIGESGIFRENTVTRSCPL